ncbi:hypothetical protein [Coleofasciculus sp. F4-SAH-05]
MTQKDVSSDRSSSITEDRVFIHGILFIVGKCASKIDLINRKT